MLAFLRECTRRAALAVTRSHEVINQHVVRLAVPVNASIALLQPVGIPGNLDVHHAMAVILQVNALGRSIRGHQDAHRADGRVGLEGGFDLFAIFGRHPPIEGHQVLVLRQPFRRQASL